MGEPAGARGGAAGRDHVAGGIHGDGAADGGDRWVVHLDMDAFFAAIEVRDDPRLRGLPVIVGGDGPRGVVASCTYEARAYGVRSAMPSMEARRRCPSAVFVPPHHDRYAAVSAELHRLLRQVTPVVEPIGLDEAFLDLTGTRRRLGPPEEVAVRLVAEVAASLHLTCAAGVAHSKSLAKLASRRAKAVPPARRRPGDGVVVVHRDEERAFLHPLPVDALWGVGPATAARLAGLGIATVGDLAAVPADVLARLVGAAAGTHLAALAACRDEDPVVADRPTKSIGRETTLARDLRDRQALAPVLADLAGSVGDRLGGAGLAGRTVTLKVRFADRRTVTRATTVADGVDGPHRVLAAARRLLDQVDVTPGVRLLGVAVSALARPGEQAVQLALLPTGPGGGHPGGGDPGGGHPGGGHPGGEDPGGDPRSGAARNGRAGPTDRPGRGSGADGADGTDGAAADDGRWRLVDGALVAVRRRFGADAVRPAITVRGVGEHDR